MTADLWDWVEDQAGTTLDADDVNAVLDRSAGAADDEDVSLQQFTHVVVHMFEQFFHVLDKQGCGYLTQVCPPPPPPGTWTIVFSSNATGEAAAKTRWDFTRVPA